MAAAVEQYSHQSDAAITVRLVGAQGNPALRGATNWERRARARQQPEAGFLVGADLSGQIYTGLSALAHAALVGALAFFLPAMHSDDADSIDRNAAAAMKPTVMGTSPS